MSTYAMDHWIRIYMVISLAPIPNFLVIEIFFELVLVYEWIGQLS